MALFGRYEYVGELGRGTTGRVVLALDLANGEAPRALKVVAAEQGARLLWEFSRLARVEHRRVARLRELLRIDSAVGAPFSLAAGSLVLVEDRAPGQAIARLAAAAEGEPGRHLRLGLAIALGVAEGLAAVHEAGLVHGDVKPDNVMWDEERGATVIDLGFARAASAQAVVRGTPRFMAPELLAGLCTPAADVFALGALLFDWLQGEVSDHPSSLASSEQGSPFVVRDAAALSASYPEDVRRLVGRFLERDPELRPVDGRAALHALLGLHQALGYAVDAATLRFASTAESATPGERAQRARTLPFVGQGEPLSALVSAIDEVLRAPGPMPPIQLVGPRGAGHSRLVREAVRVVQEQRAQAGMSVPTSLERVSALDRLRDVDALLWLERPSASELRTARRAQEAFFASGQHLCLVVEGALPEESEAPRAKRIELGPMPLPEFERLLERLIAPARSERVREAARAASAGLAGNLCECAVDAFLNGNELSDPASYRPRAGALDARGWSQRGQDLALWLAWTQGAPHEPQDIALSARALGGEQGLEYAFDELSARGALVESAGEVSLLPELARSIRGQGVEAWRARFAALAPIARLEGAPFLQALLGERGLATRRFASLAAEHRLRGQHELARVLLHEALQVAPDDALRLELAELERKRAHYGVARKVLSDAGGSAAAWMRAELARLAGDRESARAALVDARDAPWQERARALQARLAYDAADFEGARRELVSSGDIRDAEARLRALEVEVLLALGEGRPESARVPELVGGAERLGKARPLARALSLRAQVELALGRRPQAREDLRRAQRESESAGELHEAATYGMNLGLLELDAGNLGEALEALRAAAYSLAFIDRAQDLTRVLFNLGSAALLVGDDERADWVLADAEGRAAAGTDPAVRALIAVARSESSLRRGAVEQAEARLGAALEQLPNGLPAVEAILAARAGLVQVLRGERARALALLARGRAAGGGVEAELELAVLELRANLAAGDPGQALAVARRTVAEVDRGTASFATKTSVLLAAGDAARAAGDETLASEWTGRCRALLEVALAGLQPALRASMRRIPAHARVLAGQPTPGAPLDERGAERWRTLVKGARRLFAERRPSRIAQRAVELALDLVHAERALVVLEQAGSALRVLSRAELTAEPARELGFSQSVVRRVWLDSRPVISLEAARDERFDGAQSVHTLSVRSVLAVPLLGFQERAVLYLDDRLRGSAFGADEQALLTDLAELTRQALGAGQAVLKEQRRALQSAQQEKRLSRQLEVLAAQPARPTDVPFIGASNALARLTERARRVAASDVPILIAGQSGTGKELLARFIHTESPRRAAPFVAENCAALPDTLLESALFGHVRGAFTGADRPRRGLFESADGGSLLLDEVAEMSPALQGKLLRVLQEGEFRVLGSEKVRKVDVRVMAASHRDLVQLVREGKFREDLYYRLAVVTLEVPTLAERREDVPLLVQHFVRKYAGEREVRVSAEAMRLLESRSYPGNVRQLENEVRRALALCDGTMRADHVEEPLVPASEAGRAGTLDLHAQTEELTRKLVESAMQRTGGNVSQAAQLLGISRFGLQKILKRLKGAEPPPPQRK
ncbi:MAG: sigma 54-interacting transcriptional regulator [Myxococcales bacterium]